MPEEPNEPKTISQTPAQTNPTDTTQTPESTPSPTPAEAASPEPSQPTPEPAQPQSGTITLVWQWLTYGLWSWTLAALGVLVSSTLAYFIVSDSKSSDYTWLVYVIATTLCLLPISYVIDRIYSKNEPEHKHGFAAVILVIHAVLAFLVSIGALITAVVTLLSLATDTSSDSKTKITVIISALLIAVLGGLFFVRIVRPAKLAIVTRRFGLIVTVVATIAVVAALAGPYLATVQTKQDRRIESGLEGVNSAIQSYASQNQKLPSSLSDLSFESYYKTSEDLVKNHLVTYTSKDGVAPTSSPYNYSRTYKYELCVDYKKAAGSGKVSNSTSAYDTYSSSYLSTSSHPAGHTCYQQSAYVGGIYTTKPLSN